MLAITKKIPWHSWVPSNCPGCNIRTVNQSLCSKCTLSLLDAEQKSRCLICQQILNNGLCANCSTNVIHYDSVISAFDYKGLGQQLVQSYKIQMRLSLVGLLANLLAQSIVNHSFSVYPDLIVPVPAHFSSLRKRGFSPPAEVARLLAKRFNCNYQLGALVRVRETTKQTSLDYKQRLLAAQTAFACGDIKLKGKNVVVVDDVMTTGATLNAIANVLKQAGANSVHCWVLARTLR